MVIVLLAFLDVFFSDLLSVHVMCTFFFDRLAILAIGYSAIDISKTTKKRAIYVHSWSFDD